MKRPLLLIAVGIVIGSGILIYYSLLLALMLILMLLICFKILLKNKISFYIIAISLVLGGLHVYWIQSEINSLTYLDDGIAYPIIGEVYHVKIHEKYTLYYLKNIDFQNNGRSFGRGLLYDYNESGYMEGDSLAITGSFYSLKENTNPDGFNHKLYCYSKGIYYGIESQDIKIYQSAKTFRLGSKIHQVVKTKLNEYFSGPIIGLLETVLIGDGNQLETNLAELFRKTGLAHMLAISGLHLSIVVLGIYSIINGLGVKGKEWMGMGIMVAYVLITGGQISTLRASLMLGLFFIGQLIIRRYDSYSALAFAVTIILLFSPYALTQPGFLLSVTAVIGIIYIGPKIGSLLSFLSPNDLMKTFYAYMAPLIGIMIMTTPIILYYFYGISLLSVVINMIGFPFIWGLLVFGILTVLMPINGMAQLFALFTNWCYQFLISIAKAGDSIPNQYWIMGKPSVFTMIIYYLILLMLVNPLLRGKLIDLFMYFRGKAYQSVLILTGCLFIVIIGKVHYTPLEITHLDVGQGDCSVILYQGKSFLVDTGGKSFTLSKDNVGMTVVKPYLEAQGIREIEGVLISHTDYDHVAGLMELIGQIPIRAIYLPKVYEQFPDQVIDVLEQLAEVHEIEIIYLEAGDGIGYKDLTLTCLYPKDKGPQKNNNDHSMVLLLEKGAFSYLFTGDITQVGENLMHPILKGYKSEKGDFIEGMKVAHHGSKYSSTPEFIELIQPEVAVVSYGKNNIYGHPAKQTLSLLEHLDIKTYKTGEEGAIRIVYTGIMVYYMDSMLVDGKDYYLCKP